MGQSERGREREINNERQRDIAVGPLAQPSLAELGPPGRARPDTVGLSRGRAIGEREIETERER